MGQSFPLNISKLVIFKNYYFFMMLFERSSEFHQPPIIEILNDDYQFKQCGDLKIKFYPSLFLLALDLNKFIFLS